MSTENMIALVANGFALGVGVTVLLWSFLLDKSRKRIERWRATARRMATEARRQRARGEEAVELLMEMEWTGGDMAYCPCCGLPKHLGHRADFCRLARIIGKDPT